jgi:hypothetical protein
MTAAAACHVEQAWGSSMVQERKHRFNYCSDLGLARLGFAVIVP